MKTIVFLADGFEECEALIVVDILRRAGIDTVMASVMKRLEVESSRRIKVLADAMAEDVDLKSADLVFLPGGRLGTKNLECSVIVQMTVREYAEKKHVAAICAAPRILAGLGLLNHKKATCHPDFESQMSGAILTGDSVSMDGNIITGQGLGAAFPLAFELVKMFMGSEKVDEIKKDICY